MKDKDYFNFKNVNKYYVKQRENELKKLEIKKTELLKNIDLENGRLEENRKGLAQINSENLQLRNEYEYLKNTLINRGLILDVENQGYQIKEWDNLNLLNKRGSYIISTRKEEELYTLDKDASIILSDILNSGYNCSVIAVRTGVRFIRLQLRFVKEEK